MNILYYLYNISNHIAIKITYFAKNIMIYILTIPLNILIWKYFSELQHHEQMKYQLFFYNNIRY